jgi:hypothetical protein
MLFFGRLDPLPQKDASVPPVDLADAPVPETVHKKKVDQITSVQHKVVTRYTIPSF